jgi:DNA-binding transcriptional regulator YdaS (Cro superfamily)
MSISEAKKAAVTRAKERLHGPTGLARALSEIGPNITPQAVSQWDEVPLKRIFDVERATGISREELRPDFFGDDTPEPVPPSERDTAA